MSPASLATLHLGGWNSFVFIWLFSSRLTRTELAQQQISMAPSKLLLVVFSVINLYGVLQVRLLGAVYMQVGRDVCRDGIFFGFTWNCFYPGLTISPGTICKVNIILSRQSGMECLYDKNFPALVGIPFERTGIPLCRDGTKNMPAKFFPYKRNGTISVYICLYLFISVYTCMARSCLTSRPASHITVP